MSSKKEKTEIRKKTEKRYNEERRKIDIRWEKKGKKEISGLVRKEGRKGRKK